MRKALALVLIKLAHRINPPKVTELALPDPYEGYAFAAARFLRESGYRAPGAGYALREHFAPPGSMPPERRESRGWN